MCAKVCVPGSVEMVSHLLVVAVYLLLECVTWGRFPSLATSFELAVGLFARGQCIPRLLPICEISAVRDG